ncbi:sodium:proton antiporter [Kineosporia sp. NBRC 101731]|uniref:cation:proton antiporter n=1 Tax=Kineosporia sp. NBRC 101731 TaxID=3032199 RepID=UPI002553B30D|nr:sodium:proton antiporter [Kineosporia sp. NBRC 101731]
MSGVEILLIVGAGIAVYAIAGKRGLQPGMVVVVLAAVVSFIPGVPRLELESELILALVVPPLLYSATRATPVSGFAANLGPIVSLGVVLVVITTGVLGLVSSWLMPSIGLAGAFVLGAVLAPPDTITTVSHGRELGLPRRATQILTGESLVNDATALTVFSLAIAAVNGQGTSVGGGLATFLLTVVVGLVVGLVFAVGTLSLRKRLGNPTLEVALVLLVPFTAFLVSEELHGSGILAVVAAAFMVSANLTFDPKHQYPGAHRTRLAEEQVWKVIDFLLENFVFAYIGLQLKFVLEDLADAEELTVTLISAGVLLVVAIVVRMLGVFGLFGRRALAERWAEWIMKNDPRARLRRQQRNELFEQRRQALPLGATSFRENVLVGWTGMRGILTLAAAAAVPETTTSGAPFPGRDAIQAIALIVTLGTLLVQGTTIRKVAVALKFDVEAEKLETVRNEERGRELVRDAVGPDGPRTPEDYQKQRDAVGFAMATEHLDESVMREIVEDIDLRQAAAERA